MKNTCRFYIRHRGMPADGVCSFCEEKYNAGTGAATGFRLETGKSKAWVTGRIALDSGYAKSVTLTAPTLSLSGMFHTELAYLNESDGTFTLEAEIYGPQGSA